VSRWDPRWKLAAILLACGATACLRTPAAAAAALGIALLLAAISRIPPRRIAARLALIAVSLAPFIAVLPFIEGTTLALVIGLRALAIGMLALVLLATPIERVLVASQSLGLPGPLVQIALLAQRYAHTFADEFHRLRIAWRVRGFQPAADAATARTLAHGIGALLVRSHDRGTQVSHAMRARGFDGTFRTLAPCRTTVADVLGSVAVMAMFVALVVGEQR